MHGRAGGAYAAGMAEIDARVWSAWREVVADAGVNWALRMLFVPVGVDVQQAEVALRSSVRDVGVGHDEVRAPVGAESGVLR